MATTPKRRIIQNDSLGLTNIRLLKSEEPADYTRVESASLKVTSKFWSPEGKRLFLRVFVTAQLQFNFIGGVVRAVTSVGTVDPLIDSFSVLVSDLHQQLNEAIDGAELLFKQHGITQIASYDTPPLEVEVPIVSALARRFYEAIVKFDQLMPLLQTLQIHEIVTDQEILEWRSQLKEQFRHVASTSRRTADRLRARVFMVAKEGQVPATGSNRSGASKSKPAPTWPTANGKHGTPTGVPSSKAGAKQVHLRRDGKGGERGLFSAAARKRHNKRLRKQGEAVVLAAGMIPLEQQAHASAASGADTSPPHAAPVAAPVPDAIGSHALDLSPDHASQDGPDKPLDKINGHAREGWVAQASASDAMHTMNGRHALEPASTEDDNASVLSEAPVPVACLSQPTSPSRNQPEMMAISPVAPADDETKR